MTWLGLLVACGGMPNGAAPPGLLRAPDPAGTGGGSPEDPRLSQDFAPPMPHPSVPVTSPATPDVLPRRGVPAFPNVDVLVIGAGPAGLAAALEASRAGATVAVLEREDDFGGSANWAGALMLFSGTPQQAADGIVDSSDQLLAEWAALTGGDPTDPWVKAFATRNVPDVYDWLTALGVTWTGPGYDSSAGETPRIQSVHGEGPALVAAIEAPLDGGTILYEAEATALVQDGTGRVVGVEWRDLALDEAHFARADTVIVATGGFLQDLDRVRTARPDLVDKELRWGSWPGADGNGLELVAAVGGTTENLGAIGLYAHGIPGFSAWHELRSSVLASVPWFNAAGARFVDESDVNNFRVGELRAAQAGEDVWAVFDSTAAATAIFEQPEPGTPAYGIDTLLATGLATESEDLDTLAATLGIDAAVLTAEIDAYNRATAGLAPDAYRGASDGGTPVGLPPYYAVPVAITVAKGFGGVDVNLDGRVLDEAGAVIPGLYAAGELTGMAGGTLVGSYGFTGSLTAVILGGRIAGASAASETTGG